MHPSVVRFAFAKMDNWRCLRVKVKNHWNNFRRLLQPYLNYDYDRCLDLIMIGAGIRPLPGAEPWKRNCRILYRLLGFYQVMMSIAKVVFSIRNGNDTFELIASTVLLVSLLAVYAKAYTLGYYAEVVQQSNTFVNSNFSFSRDPDYDAKVRRDHAGTPGKVSLAIFVIFCCYQVIIMIPSSARDTIYGIPEQFNVLGTMTTRLLQEIFVVMLAIFVGCGYFSASLTVIPLLNGLKHELMIVGHGYEMVVPLDDQNSATESSRKLKNLKQQLEITVEQHVEVLRIIHLVQPLVSHLYVIIYFSAMVIVSLLVFVGTNGEVTLITLVIVGSTGLSLVECYFWCHMIDSIQETMETTADCISALGFGLQHSMDNHSEYIEMRTSIMIIQLSGSQRDLFKCGGIFPISVESFGNLCMIIYRFATFLLNFE